MAVEREGEVEEDLWGAEGDYDGIQEHSRTTQASSDLQREWESRRLQFHNLGYRDGITAGNNSSVQEGFNLGFQEAVGPGFGWGVARGAASAYAHLPFIVKELLLKDGEARKRLEALQLTMASISSADAMGMYYNDSVLRNGANADGSAHGRFSGSISDSPSLQTRLEDEASAKQSEPEDALDACCGGSRACSSHVVDGVSKVARHSTVDASNAQPSSSSAVAPDESRGNEPVSEEAREFVLREGTSLGDAKQLEDSTLSHLFSMALGDPSLGASTSRSSGSSSRLEEYQKNVAAELEQSTVKLSTFPPR